MSVLKKAMVVAIFPLSCFVSGGCALSPESREIPELPSIFVFRPKSERAQTQMDGSKSITFNAIDYLVSGEITKSSPSYLFYEGVIVENPQLIQRIISRLPSFRSNTGHPAYCGYAAYIFIGPPYSQDFKLFNNGTLIRCGFDLSCERLQFNNFQTNAKGEPTGHCERLDLLHEITP